MISVAVNCSDTHTMNVTYLATSAAEDSHKISIPA